MYCVWKPCIASHRKRLAIALVALPLCALVAACGNDDTQALDTSRRGSASNAADAGSGDGNGKGPVLSANPFSASALPAAATIQSPALPASSAGLVWSAAAPAPLATPVIHTVD